MSQQSTETFFASLEDEGMRLDRLLVSRFPHHSRSYFQFLIEQGSVLVEEQVLKKRARIKAGDEIEICFILTPELSLIPENIPLDILYEDEHLLIVNKPVGMVVHPAPGHPSGTFAHALLYYCKQLKPEEFSDLRPGIVHRLDKDTSGVLLAAKNPQTHQKLVALFTSRQIEKHYLAISLGRPKTEKICAPIARHPKHRQKMAVVENGKEAITLCQQLAEKGPLSLLSLQILTGRTHQIRVHLSYLGHPVLGDALYGNLHINQKYGVVRQLLHAHRLKFIHPFTSKILEIEAPIPTDFDLNLYS